jgi:type II secretory pathway component PulF
VVEDVEGGTTLSDSMAKHAKAFDRLYCKMVNAGEIGGVLDVILQRLAVFMEKAQRLRRRIIGALIYPVAVITVAVVIVTGIMVFVIPKFQEIFNDFQVELPILTIKLIDASLWVAGKQAGQSIPGWVWIISSPFLAFLFFKLIRKTGPGRAVTDIIRLKIPVLGGLIKKTSVARFTRTLGTLISAGVPILEAIMITRDTSGNYVYEKALTKVHDSIREGETFSGPLREAKVCDAMVVNMIDVGEETGDLDAMLMKIADNYDEEVDVARRLNRACVCQHFGWQGQAQLALGRLHNRGTAHRHRRHHHADGHPHGCDQRRDQDRAGRQHPQPHERDQAGPGAVQGRHRLLPARTGRPDAVRSHRRKPRPPQAERPQGRGVPPDVGWR